MKKNSIIYYINTILFVIYIVLFVNAITGIVDFYVSAIVDFLFLVLLVGNIGLSCISFYKVLKGDKRKIALISSMLGLIVLITLVISYIFFMSTLNSYF